MSSVVQICNIALTNIGETKIAALTEENERARVVNLRYEDSRDSVLRTHPWNCAVTRVELSADVTAPAWGYAKRYALPADCLRVLDIENNYEKYEVEGRFLVTDSSSMKLKYIKKVTDPTDFDSLLTHAVAMKLASEIAENLTGRADLRDRMLAKYLQILSEARGVDSQETSLPGEFIADDYINARLVGSTYRRAKFSSEV